MVHFGQNTPNLDHNVEALTYSYLNLVGYLKFGANSWVKKVRYIFYGISVYRGQNAS